MDHSNLEAKLATRIWAVEELPDPVVVLDAFAGQGVVWALVRDRYPHRDIQVTAIEADPATARPGAIVADNLAWLAEADLDRFTLVDLDSWGWPNRELTVISRRLARLPHVALTRPLPGPRSRVPGAVRSAGGWRRFVGRLGWRIADTAADHGGAMAYERLEPFLRRS